MPHLKSSKLNKSWRHLLEELQLSYFSSCQNIRILCCQLNTGKNFTIKLKLLLMLNFVLLIFCHSHFVIRYIFIISLLLDISLLTQKRVFKNTFSLFCFNNFHFFFFFLNNFRWFLQGAIWNMLHSSRPSDCRHLCMLARLINSIVYSFFVVLFICRGTLRRGWK